MARAEDTNTPDLVLCYQSEFQRVVRATLELPPATDAELEMLDILTRGGRRLIDSDECSCLRCPSYSHGLC